VAALAFFGFFFLVITAVALHDWAAAAGMPVRAGARRTTRNRSSAGDIGRMERRLITQEPRVDRLDLRDASVDSRTAMADR
jgi:hypothetical protein